MRVINLTPHAITIEGYGTIEPSGQVARVSTVRAEAPAVAGIRVTRQSAGDIEGLPEPQEGVIYLVSGMVLAATNRADVYAPDTGADAIRNEKGHIVAVRGLVQSV